MSAAENSVRADLEAAMKEHAEPAEIVETEVVETAAAEVESEAQKQERARDDRGRFVAKASEESEALGDRDSNERVVETAREPAAKQEDSSSLVESEKTQPQASLAPPNGWSAEAKAKWHELPPEIMAAVQKREQDVAKFTSTRDEHASFGREMYQAVQPYLPTIRSQGGTPRGVVESMLQSAHVLYTGSPEQKKQMLLTTARQFGVDLGIAPDPNARQVAPEIASLQQEIAQLKGLLTQQQEAGQQQLQTEITTELQAFASDPKHPHFQEVKVHMAALLKEGAAKDLQDAYEQATWARPDIRATLLAQQRADEEQKRRTEAKRKADEAKRKSVSVTGGPGNTAQASAPGGRSIREELESAIAASSGAV